MAGATKLTRRGLLGRRVLKRFLYAQMQFRNAIMIAAGKDGPLVRFTVEDDPPSVYLVFRVVDVDGLAAELGLPAPLDLAPIRCVEGETPEYYLTLNVYRVSGITNGLRAEWSVYATDADGIVRYVVIDARSSRRSMDPVDVITPPSRVDHVRVGTSVTMTVGDDPEAFRASFELTDDTPRVMTDRQWATANDDIYWRNGICDRTFYDAGMADAEVAAVDPSTVEVDDRTTWSRFVDPTPAHVLAFTRAIELVVAPWNNVDDL